MNTKEKIEFSKAGYNQTAEIWDRTRRLFWPELADAVLKYFKKEAPEAILDLGCGNGRLLPILLENNPHIDYTGADISDGLISIAKKRYKDSKQVNFLSYDGQKLPLGDNAFDVIISVAVLHHLPSNSIDDWLQDARRVAARNATFIFTSWDVAESKKLEIRNYFWKNFVRNILHFKPPIYGEFVMGFVHYKNTRYIHAYSQKDLEKIFNRNKFKILESKVVGSPKSDDKNILIVAKNM